jgi:hypothetical protein
MITTDATIDNTYDLIAHIYQRALKDARRGDKEAIQFLDITAPDWQELSNKYQGIQQPFFVKLDFN